MPQTSPINWTMLSFAMVLSILYTFSSINEKTTHSMPKKYSFNLTTWSWKW